MKLSEELHFTRAAESLGISQPTLSHQIQLLEGRLGTKLLQRTGRRISLTQSGRVLLEHARKVFYELEQANAEIRELEGLQRGSLAVGCAGNHVLIGAARTFHQQHPEVLLSITDMRSEETIEALLNHQLDLGVIFLLTEDPRLESIRLFDEEFCLVVSKYNPISSASSVSLDDLQSIPLALLPKRYLIRQFIDEYTAEHGVQFTPMLQLSSLESQLAILSIHSLGTILTKSYVQQISDPSLVSIPIADAPRKTVGLVYPRQAYLDHVSRTFIEHVLMVYRSAAVGNEG